MYRRLHDNIPGIDAFIDRVDGNAFRRIFEKAPCVRIRASVPGKERDMKIKRPARHLFEEVARQQVSVIVADDEVGPDAPEAFRREALIRYGNAIVPALEVRDQRIGDPVMRQKKYVHWYVPLS